MLKLILRDTDSLPLWSDHGISVSILNTGVTSVFHCAPTATPLISIAAALSPPLMRSLIRFTNALYNGVEPFNALPSPACLNSVPKSGVPYDIFPPIDQSAE